MAKKVFGMPMVFAAQVTPGPTPPPGLGSSQGTIDDEPWSWEMWQTMYEEDDSNGNGIPCEYSDYVKWMTDRGFGAYITPEEDP